LIPEEKKVKFKVLRENVLASKTVTLKTLQRFAGKAIAGCKVYLQSCCWSCVIPNRLLRSLVFSNLNWNIEDF